MWDKETKPYSNVEWLPVCGEYDSSSKEEILILGRWQGFRKHVEHVVVKAQIHSETQGKYKIWETQLISEQLHLVYVLG